MMASSPQTTTSPSAAAEGEPPLLSIIITTLPGDDPATAILGTLGQSLSGLQVIVTHDGTGVTAESAMTFAARHPGLVAAVQPPRPGLAAAVNCALDQARGRYVTFLESHWAPATGCFAALAPLLDAVDTDLCKYSYCSGNPNLMSLITDPVSRAMMNRQTRRLPFLGQWRSAFYARELLNEHRLRLNEALAWGAELLFHVQAVLACRRPTFCGNSVCYAAVQGQSPDLLPMSRVQIQSGLQVMRLLENMLVRGLPRDDPEALILSYLQLLEQLGLMAQLSTDPADARRCLDCHREMLQRCPRRADVAALLGDFHSVMPYGGRGAPPPHMAGQGVRLTDASLTHPLFRHSGSLGDVIYSLPALAALTARCGGQGAVLCLQTGTGRMLSEGGARSLMPLLQLQPYIREVRLWQGEQVDFDLDVFRTFSTTGRGDITRWYQYAFPVVYDTSAPWLSGIEPDSDAAGTLVIARALRRQAPGLDYGFLRRYGRVLFIGIEREFAEMQAVIPQLQWRRTADFLDMARVIAAARLFIGSQSSPFAVAEALKVPRLLELPLDEPVGVPAGPGGAVFCVQECFEQLAAELWEHSDAGQMASRWAAGRLAAPPAPRR